MPESFSRSDVPPSKGKGNKKLQLVGSSTDTNVIRYERLRRGNFFADFRRDRCLYPEVYHCIVQRTGDAQILVWTQHTTLDSARATAEEHLQRLSSSDNPGTTLPEAKSRAAK
jgi:hypothetical protein